VPDGLFLNQKSQFGKNFRALDWKLLMKFATIRISSNLVAQHRATQQQKTTVRVNRPLERLNVIVARFSLKKARPNVDPTTRHPSLIFRAATPTLSKAEDDPFSFRGKEQ
jgi:hypothetical protein